MDLRALGWDDFFAASAKGANLVPARVALVFRGGYEVWTERGEFLAQVSGRFRHLTEQGRQSGHRRFCVGRRIP